MAAEIEKLWAFVAAHPTSQFAGDCVSCGEDVNRTHESDCEWETMQGKDPQP